MQGERVFIRVLPHLLHKLEGMQWTKYTGHGSDRKIPSSKGSKMLPWKNRTLSSSCC